MSVDPARFIVRNLAYPQDIKYLKDCGTIVENALGNKDINSANDLVSFIAKALRVHQGSGHHSRIYGAIRDQTPDEFDNKSPGNPRTSLAARYRAPVVQAMRRLGQLQKQGRLPPNVKYDERMLNIGIGGEKWAKHVQFFLDEGHSIPLSEIILYEDVKDLLFNRIYHPSTYALSHDPRPERSYEEEIRWSAISHAFTVAMNPGHPKTEQEKRALGIEREKQALTFYSLLCHDMPVKHGSATLARIALEYMAQKIGFDIPFTKQNCDLNIEAITRTPQDFVEAWRNCEFFDREVSSVSVTKWQNDAIRKQRNLRAKPGHYRK